MSGSTAGIRMTPSAGSASFASLSVISSLSPAPSGRGFGVTVKVEPPTGLPSSSFFSIVSEAQVESMSTSWLT